METREDISNGANLKRQRSGRNFSISFVLVAFMMLIFAACKKNPLPEEDFIIIEDNPTSFVVKAYNVDVGGREIDSVKVQLHSAVNTSLPNIWFTSKFNNGGFEMSFPATIPDAYLFSLSKPEDGVSISDMQAKIRRITLVTFNSTDRAIGWCNFRNDNSDVSFEFVYADRSYTMKGINNGNEYNCTYKKGWNIEYHAFIEKTSKNIYNTVKPNTVKFKCFVENVN